MEINEKKLTDEETIQVLDECFAKVGVMSCEGCKVYSGNGLRDCMKHIGRLALDLIYRLQDEKQKVIQDYYAEKQTCDEQKDIIERLKTEKKHLSEEYDRLSECFARMKKTKAEQKAEIERLTEYNANLNGMCLEFTDKNAELQNQVDELKEEMHKIESAANETYMLGFEEGEKKAVKDTAKGIYDFAKDFFEWDEEGFVRELKEFVQGYGVEVE